MIKEDIKQITNIEELQRLYIELNNETEKQEQEIERLKDKLYDVKAHYETEAEAKYYEFIDNHESKLQQRIDKAIEWINNLPDGIKSTFIIYGGYEVKEILQGNDKE